MGASVFSFRRVPTFVRSDPLVAEEVLGNHRQQSQESRLEFGLCLNAGCERANDVDEGTSEVLPLILVRSYLVSAELQPSSLRPKSVPQRETRSPFLLSLYLSPQYQRLR